MADYNLKTITADTDGPSADTELLFGAPDQSSGTPKPYSFAGMKAWIRSWAGDPTPTIPFLADANVYNAGPVAGFTTAVVTANRLYMVPVYLRGGQTYTTLAMIVTVAGAGSTVGQLALYASVAATGRPTGLPVATGAAAMAMDSVAVKTATISYTPTTSGWYFIAYIGNTGATCCTFNASNLAGGTCGLIFTATPTISVAYGIWRNVTYSASPFVDETATTFTVPAGTIIPVLGIR